MINYYEILGLSSGAGILEIKASFRNLAKLYHPDKNPEGIEHFTKILKAYETLSNPTLKASYDYKLNYHQSQSQHQAKATANTKTWKFDERELKRRQYYNDHIKKYAKQTSEYMAEAETKKNYNEFKYILFATPLAVILFLLIMHFATGDREEAINTFSQTQLRAMVDVETAAPLKTGDTPYDALFGYAKYNSQANKSIFIKNRSGQDVVFCFFTEKDFVGSVFIGNNFSAEVSQLPDEPLYLAYSQGLKFDLFKQVKGTQVKGGFTEQESFFRSIKPLSPNNELSLEQSPLKGFEKINAKEFFKRTIN